MAREELDDRLHTARGLKTLRLQLRCTGGHNEILIGLIQRWRRHSGLLQTFKRADRRQAW